jgi:hypothetical protein
MVRTVLVASALKPAVIRHRSPRYSHNEQGAPLDLMPRWFAAAARLTVGAVHPGEPGRVKQ